MIFANHQIYRYLQFIELTLYYISVSLKWDTDDTENQIKFILIMKYKKVLCCALFIFVAHYCIAQHRLLLKNNMLYTDITIKNDLRKCETSAMIDTGASVCMIDSTYAVDSCNIELPNYNSQIESATGTKIKSRVVRLNEVRFGNSTALNLDCYVVDLKGVLKEYAPNFIVGGDLLKRNIWMFDLKNMTLVRCDSITKKHQDFSSSFKWKNHNDYSDAFTNSIFFKGKIGGKKTRILLDTGSKRNILPTKFNIAPTKMISLERGDLANSITSRMSEVCEGVQVEIQNFNTSLDFVLSDESYPTINSEFLWGKVFLLDYNSKTLNVIK